MRMRYIIDRSYQEIKLLYVIILYLYFCTNNIANTSNV